MERLVRFLLDPKAESPMEVTLSGMEIFVRLRDPMKAAFPMEVMLSGRE